MKLSQEANFVASNKNEVVEEHEVVVMLTIDGVTD